MSLTDFLRHLQDASAYEDQLVAVRRLPAREARFGDLERPLPEELAAALRASGVERFYSHQAAAINAARRGEHVTVVTATASGKTLCYHVPVAERLLAGRAARAIYLYPTKALAQDQLGKLRGSGLYARLLPATYDGDTPAEERRLIRRAARVILTNPDMLHVSLLPRHPQWASFLANLAYVVVDEVHTYRGVFGSHVAAILRRLRRLCRHYGSDPQFITASATIANPGELVARLTGLETTVVEDDGAPRGERLFALWNPPRLGESGDRRSPNTEASWLLTELARHGIRSIVFTRARVVAELILRYAQQSLAGIAPALVERIASYRAGYTPAQRREIEGRLFQGSLLGVTATNALELGIDVGGLDAAVLVGFPGTIASTWQQAGRAGRAGQQALAVLVASDGPLDQFLMRRPEYLFERTPERAAVDPGNPYILLRQLLCAAFELPLSPEDTRLFGEELPEIADVLEGAGQLQRAGERWHWCGSGYPAADVDIRSAGGDPYRIVLRPAGGSASDRQPAEGDRLLGTVDTETALQVVYPGAVYLHQGETYLVERLDLQGQTAYVQPASVNYYTTPRVQATVRIEARHEAHALGRTECAFGDVTVTSHVVGYRRQRLLSEALLENVDLELPPRVYRTEGLWFVIPPALQVAAAAEGIDLLGAIHAIEHAAIGIAPLHAMCDRWDIGGVSHPNHPDLGQAAVFIYDAHPGGVGIAAACFERLDQVLRETLDNIRACECSEGCPSCIQSPKCGNNNHPLDKAGAAWLLAQLLVVPGDSPPVDQLPTVCVERSLSPSAKQRE
jgi:DEAD/DEAH box helicase domain-containing protein